MKTLYLLLTFSLTFNFISIAQRNPTEDRKNSDDRIDRDKD